MPSPADILDRLDAWPHEPPPWVPPLRDAVSDACQTHWHEEPYRSRYAGIKGCPACNGTGRIPLDADDERLVTRVLELTDTLMLDDGDYMIVSIYPNPERVLGCNGKWICLIGPFPHHAEATGPTPQAACLAAVWALLDAMEVERAH